MLTKPLTGEHQRKHYEELGLVPRVLDGESEKFEEKREDWNSV